MPNAEINLLAHLEVHRLADADVAPKPYYKVPFGVKSPLVGCLVDTDSLGLVEVMMAAFVRAETSALCSASDGTGAATCGFLS